MSAGVLVWHYQRPIICGPCITATAAAWYFRVLCACCVVFSGTVCMLCGILGYCVHGHSDLLKRVATLAT